MKAIPARPGFGFDQRRLGRRFAVVAGLLLASVACGQTSLSFDFESPAFSSGSIMGQSGWSAGADGNTLLTDPNDHVTVTSEGITTDAAHSGTQSWRYDHGISGGYQFGPGTPFSPNLSANLGVGYQFSGTLYFKAVSLGDGSYIRIDGGTPAGDDRAEILAYLNNDAGNLNVTLATVNATRDDFTEVTVGGNLDSGWHRLDFSVTRVGTDLNTVRAMIDGSDLMSATVEGALGFYRGPEGLNIPYEQSTRLKFSGSLTGAGFYFDDISYSISAAPVPEPATAAAILGSLALLGVIIRRRRMAG